MAMVNCSVKIMNIIVGFQRQSLLITSQQLYLWNISFIVGNFSYLEYILSLENKEIY